MTHRLTAAVAFAAVLLSASVHAVDYRAEYDKKIKAAQDVGVLGNGLAGDQTNFYTGSTSFSATDLSIPGNSALPVAIGRRYSVEFDRQAAITRGSTSTAPEVFGTAFRDFGDWDLDVPNISAVMTQANGWVVGTSAPGVLPITFDKQRCSVIGRTNVTGAPPSVKNQGPGLGPHTFGASTYWHGYTLHAGGSDQSLLVASVPNTNRPSTGGPYHWTTNQRWWASCIPTVNPDTFVAGGMMADDGEGFLVISPDGTKYTFNRLSKRNVNDSTYVTVQIEASPPYRDNYIYRAEYQMLPTSIEDRFGNWVHYAWSNDDAARLQNITASDGRAISVVYDASGRIASATEASVDSGGSIVLGTRSVAYQYAADPYSHPANSGSSLKKVVLADGTFWRFGSGTNDGFIGLNWMSAVVSDDSCLYENPPPMNVMEYRRPVVVAMHM